MNSCHFFIWQFLMYQNCVCSFVLFWWSRKVVCFYSGPLYIFTHAGIPASLKQKLFQNLDPRLWPSLWREVLYTLCGCQMCASQSRCLLLHKSSERGYSRWLSSIFRNDDEHQGHIWETSWTGVSRLQKNPEMNCHWWVTFSFKEHFHGAFKCSSNRVPLNEVQMFLFREDELLKKLSISPLLDELKYYFLRKRHLFLNFSHSFSKF